MHERALRKLRTFHREQATFEVVMESDDELRTIRLVHKSLMKLTATARRRVVRYMVERHVTSTEPEVVSEEATDAPNPRMLSTAESIAEAKRHLEASA